MYTATFSRQAIRAQLSLAEVLTEEGMDYRKLQALIAVSEAGSLSAAAEGLHCTQSAVTQIMNSIENEFGFAVFRRTNRGVTLTKEGESIMPHVRRAEKSLSVLSEEAKRIVEGIQMSLAIGTFSSISAMLLPGIITEFRKIHPNVSFEILVGTEELPAWMESGKAHLLITDKERKVGSAWKPVLEDSIYAAIPESYGLGMYSSVTLDTLLKYPLIVNLYDIFQFKNAADRLADNPNVIRIKADDSLAQLRMVSGEMGIALLPALSLRMDTIPENVDLLELDPPLHRTIGVCLPDKPHPLAKEFAAFLVRHV